MNRKVNINELLEPTLFSKYKSIKLKGVYMIENIITNKVYIGCSVNILARNLNHFHLLRHNKHYNNHLQSSYNKHGFDKFKVKILEFCDEDKLSDREIYYIDKFNSFKDGFNQNKGGKVIKHSTKPVVAYDLNGEFIKLFNSIKEASKSLKTDYDCLRAVLKGDSIQSNGYMFKEYKGSYELKITAYSKITKNYRAVICYDKKGIFINKYDSIKIAAISLGITQDGISKNLSRKNKSTHGYIFNYQ